MKEEEKEGVAEGLANTLGIDKEEILQKINILLKIGGSCHDAITVT